MQKILLSMFIVGILIGCTSTAKNEGYSSEIISGFVENRNKIKPIILIHPRYPLIALKNSLEGSCQVSFDLANKKIGSKPVNIKVILCTHQDVFLPECDRAVQRWLFKSVEAFANVESTEGLITTCEFKLNNT